MSRTINGRPVKEVLEALSAPFHEDCIKTRSYDNVAYITLEEYRERLEEVLGMDHFNEKYDDTEIVNVKDSCVAKARCTLEILDDDYNVVKVLQAYGGSTITFPKMTKKVDGKDVPITKVVDGVEVPVTSTTTTDVPNSLFAAGTDAFKHLCKKCLHMGEDQIKKKAKGTVYSGVVEKFSFYNSGHGFGTLKMDDGKEIKIAVFKNTADSFRAAFGEKVVNKKIAFYGKEGKDNQNNPQLVYSEACLEEDNAKTNGTGSKQQNELLLLHVKTITGCVAREKTPGDYSMTAESDPSKTEKDKAGKYNIIFPASEVEKMKNEGIWDRFVDRSTDTMIPLTYSAYFEASTENGRKVMIFRGFAN